MAIRRIAQIGHPVLREISREVSIEQLCSDEMQRFIDDIIETMRDANGAGLAAPQIYEPVRICVIEVRNNPRYPDRPNIPLTVLVNPRLTPLGDERFDNYEGCLSVPDLRGVAPRHAVLRVEALDRHGAALEFVARGLSAGVYQHEVDHLDGKLFLDRVVDPSTLSTWREFERHHQASATEHARAIVARYGS
ncbi:MAG: peptide deformylase [Myxococcales bacterium]|nr:peptide deformylase [Myxococcales bacterium]